MFGIGNLELEIRELVATVLNGLTIYVHSAAAHRSRVVGMHQGFARTAPDVQHTSPGDRETWKG
jgi:hypothetical protein